MGRIAAALVPVIAALVLVSVALAGTSTYAGPRQWWSGQGAGSAYSSSWFYNVFSKSGGGYDTTVTLIDAASYRWHDTVRNTSSTTYTFRQTVQGSFKGHCRAHASWFWGSCWMTN